MNKIIQIFIISFVCVSSLLAQEKNDYIDINLYIREYRFIPSGKVRLSSTLGLYLLLLKKI